MNITQALRPSGPEERAIAHLDESERYRLLADDRRRRVLELLADGDAPIAADALAAGLAGAGRSHDEESATDEVLLSLHHVHLPMLADAGVIEYDPATRDVTSADRLEP